MSEQKESQRPERSQQDLLREDFLHGRLAAADFLSRVLALDQDDPERREAGSNIKLLTDPDVLRALEHDEGLCFDLYNNLSIFYVHMGQEKLIKGMDARRDFELALEAAEKATDEEDYKDWQRYIQATLAYIDQDKEKLRQLAAEITDERNKAIAAKMLSTLENV